jgi:hypothetical protein
LSRLNGVGEVELLNGNAKSTAQGGYVTAALRQKDGFDVREEAVKTLAQNNWPLRELRLEHATLEEFFVQVTASQAAASGAAKGANQ